MPKQKILSARELRAKKEPELIKILEEALKQFRRSLIEIKSKKAKNTNSVVQQRKIIARAKTVMSEKKYLEAINKVKNSRS